MEEKEAKLKNEEKARQKALETDFPKSTKDLLSPDEGNKNVHAHNLNMCQQYLT